MRPPPLPLLQGCNALANFSAFLAINGAISLWREQGWSFWQGGLGLAIGNLAYALTAVQGGRVADRFGRAVACLAGAVVSALGCIVAWAWTEPLPVLVGLILAIGGTAIYFPGCAGLFSDAEGASGAAPPPLHAKVNRYNLGWASGIFAGFLCAAALAGKPHDALFFCALIANALLFAAFLPYRRLPPLPPPPMGDRAPHPALRGLTFMARVAIVFGCCVGMGLMSQAEAALARAGLAPDEVRRTASLIVAAYPLGYIVMFTLLGLWGGWVLRPWRLWALQLGLLVGAVAFAALAAAGVTATAPLALSAGLIGSGFGAVYVGSLYYSLRLPDGAARAAGLHETCIGIGNTGGPLIAGIAVAAWTAGGERSPMVGLGVFMIAASAVTLLWQAARIPPTMRAR